MFGYINVYKDELKIKDYKIFRAYYCGLCKSLGRFCGHITRLGLSYDMVFLMIMLSAVSETEPVFSMKRCGLHPLKKRTITEPDKISQYTAEISCLLAYLKCADDFKDDKSIKGLIGMALYKNSVNKIRKKSDNIYTFIKSKLSDLSALEKGNCKDADKVADCFAKITEMIFSYNAPKSQERQLKWIGYNIGRWIYLTDAFADLKKDFKSGAYNPFLCNKPDNIETDKYIEDLKNTIEPGLTYTLSTIASTYDLLDIKRNDDILRNIIYIGLPVRQSAELNFKACKKKKKGMTSDESI